MRVILELQLQEYYSIELEAHLRTSTVAMQHSIVRRTHFVIKLVNYTYSKLVELWPMTKPYLWVTRGFMKTPGFRPSLTFSISSF